MPAAVRLLTLPVVGVSLLMGALALVFHDASASRTAPSLPTYGRVPDFAMTDHQDQAISNASLQGQVWIADFIFTRCAGQCPMMSARMARLADTLAQEHGIAFVSFTVDPVWDTPPRLARYAQAYVENGMRWRFIHGDLVAMTRLCRDGFRLSMADGAGTPEEPITHSVRFVLIDRRGQIRGYYDATDDHAMQRLERDARRLLAESS